jgi:MinD superfamily P-loop ATPase
VDASDLHLIINPDILETHAFPGFWIARIDASICTGCAICMEHCRFDAIQPNGSGTYEIDPFRCEGCRLCERICPVRAISSERSTGNAWYVSATRFGPMVHASMGPGEENSGKLVTQCRKRAKEIAGEQHASFLINDGPPGIGCPAIASVTGSDAALLVVEPTKSSLHDAERLIKLIGNFRIPVFAIINKSGIHPEMTGRLEGFFRDRSIPLLGILPYDESVTKAMIEGLSITEYSPGSEISAMLRSAWTRLSGHLE